MVFSGTRNEGFRKRSTVEVFKYDYVLHRVQSIPASIAMECPVKSTITFLSPSVLVWTTGIQKHVPESSRADTQVGRFPERVRTRQERIKENAREYQTYIPDYGSWFCVIQKTITHETHAWTFKGGVNRSPETPQFIKKAQNTNVDNTLGIAGIAKC